MTETRQDRTVAAVCPELAASVERHALQFSQGGADVAIPVRLKTPKMSVREPRDLTGTVEIRYANESGDFFRTLAVPLRLRVHPCVTCPAARFVRKKARVFLQVSVCNWLREPVELEQLWAAEGAAGDRTGPRSECPANSTGKVLLALPAALRARLLEAGGAGARAALEAAVGLRWAKRGELGRRARALPFLERFDPASLAAIGPVEVAVEVAGGEATAGRVGQVGRLAVALTNVAARACRVRVRVAEDAGGGPAGGVFLVGPTEARAAVAPGATARCAVEYVGVAAGRGALRVDTAVWWSAGGEDREGESGRWAREEEGAVAHAHALRVPLAFAAAGDTG